MATCGTENIDTTTATITLTIKNTFFDFSGPAEDLLLRRTSSTPSLALSSRGSSLGETRDLRTPSWADMEDDDDLLPPIAAAAAVWDDSPRTPWRLSPLDYEGWPEGATVMLKGLPVQYTRGMLVELLQSEGFLHHCNFLYLPANFQTLQNVGYGFLNLESEEQTSRFFSVFEGFCDWAVDSDRVSTVSWSNTTGLRANIERFRNSPIMRKEVPDAFKPVLLSGGQAFAIPGPTEGSQRKLRNRKKHGIRAEILGL